MRYPLSRRPVCPRLAVPSLARDLATERQGVTRDRWILEVYRTVIGTLQGLAWMLLVFFVFALIAYVIVRASEAKRKAE